MIRMTGTDLKNGLLEIAWDDGAKAPFSLFWLRDHCACPVCQHPETKQRQVDTFALPSDPETLRIALEEGGRFLRIDWAGAGHASRLPAEALRAVYDSAMGGEGTATRRAPRLLWDRQMIENELPVVRHEAVMNMTDDSGLRAWLEKIERYGFCMVEGVPPTPEATKALAERVTYIRETIFGGYWDFTANMEHKDTAYTTQELGPHTDGTYSFDAPGYQMFHCLAFDGSGGESILVDGFKIAAQIRAEEPEDYALLRAVEITGQYLDHERGIQLEARRPLLRHDSRGELVQVSFNNHDRAPFWLPPERMQAFYQALGNFARRANRPDMQYRRRLKPGEVVLFDNWRVLHGRAAYQGYRRLAGVYLNKEDVESRLRVLRIRAGGAAAGTML